MSDFLNQSNGLLKNKPLLIGIGLAAVTVVFLIIVLVSAFSSDSTVSDGKLEYTCDACKAQFKSDEVKVTPKCPKCGEKAYASEWLKCPACKNVWHGIDVWRDASGKTLYRLVGDKVKDTSWQPTRANLVCPNCGRAISGADVPIIYTGWGPVPQQVIDHPKPQ